MLSVYDSLNQSNNTNVASQNMSMTDQQKQ